MRKGWLCGALAAALIVGLTAGPSGASLGAAGAEHDDPLRASTDEPDTDDLAPDPPAPDGEGDLALDAGPWILTGEATATVASSTNGIGINFFGRFPVTGLVDISSGGDANGDWVLNGSAELEVSGGPIAGTAEVTVTGDGLIGGDANQLDLVGSILISGAATVGGRTAPIDHSSAAMMRWRVLTEVCNRAWGDWVFSSDLALLNSSIAIEAEGTWTAQRDTEGTANDANATFQAIWGTTAGQPDSNLRLMRESTELIRNFNDWVDSGPNWSVGQVIAVAEKAELLIRSFDALSECERTQFNPEVIEQYLNGLTHVVQNLLFGYGALEGATTSTFVHLTHLGARVGAFGVGARNPASAVTAEESMRRAAQDILDTNADPADGVPFINDDTIRVVATAAAMGWSLNVGSGLEPAADIWARHFSEPPPDASQGNGEEDS